METIVALATPAGNGGVAIIRISGEKSNDILKSLINENVELEPRKMYLKDVHVEDIVDKCLVVRFVRPFSYTGEDVVEIHSHGGFLLAQKIIKQSIKLGAQLATPGEFSKRAFINGKMSLDQAEGVINLINAETEMQLKAGSNLLQGKLKDFVSLLQNQLTDILAEIEAKLDYPEYEYTNQESSDIKNRLSTIKSQLESILDDGKQGQIIKNGIKIAIVGAPNVGKSSLLNALTNSNRAIVTDIAGTTRDIVESEYIYKGIIFRLLDTAGIHESSDVVEKIGIERAKNAINEADLIIKLGDIHNINNIDVDKPFINVINKIDLEPNKIKKSINYVNNNNEYNTIYISAKTGENIEELKEKIFKETVKHELKQDKLYLTNTRQINCIKTCLERINNAINLIDFSTLDLVSFEIKSAWTCLGEITGNDNNEDIIDKIFSKFCLGK